MSIAEPRDLFITMLGEGLYVEKRLTEVIRGSVLKNEHMEIGFYESVVTAAE